MIGEKNTRELRFGLGVRTSLRKYPGGLVRIT